MINRDIIALLSRFKGEVLGPIHGRDDSIYVKLVKTDLIRALSRNPDSDTGYGFSITKGVGYFDRDYLSD